MRDSDASFWPDRKDDVLKAQGGLISIHARRPKEEWEKFESDFTNKYNGDTRRFGEKEVHYYFDLLLNDPILCFCFLPSCQAELL